MDILYTTKQNYCFVAYAKHIDNTSANHPTDKIFPCLKGYVKLAPYWNRKIHPPPQKKMKKPYYMQ